MASVEQVWRYPVKSMGGERVTSAAIDDRGLVGDRRFAVVDHEGRLASGKTSRRFRRRDAVFGFVARVERERVVVEDAADVAGSWDAGDPALDGHLSTVMGAAVRVHAEAETPHFDQEAVSIIGTATLAWCAREFGIDADARRLRPNLVVTTDVPFEEETWVGRDLAVGSATLHVVERVPRCRMVDVEQVGVPAEGDWLKPLAARREGCVAVYASVARAGEVRVGDEVRVGEAG